jgi:hypothetical protein
MLSNRDVLGRTVTTADLVSPTVRRERAATAGVSPPVARAPTVSAGMPEAVESVSMPSLGATLPGAGFVAPPQVFLCVSAFSMTSTMHKGA